MVLDTTYSSPRQSSGTAAEGNAKLTTLLDSMPNDIFVSFVINKYPRQLSERKIKLVETVDAEQRTVEFDVGWYGDLLKGYISKRLSGWFNNV